MKVYLLWHDPMDYESGQELRGIYAARGLAEADLPVEVVEYHFEGTQLIGPHPGKLERSGPQCTTRRHDDTCCDIEEVEVMESAMRAVALPEPRYDDGMRLIPDSVTTSNLELLAAPPLDLQRLGEQERGG